MRKIRFTPGSYYHICNRSNDKQAIFLDNKDYLRFLFSILFSQAPISFHNIGRQISHFTKQSTFNIPAEVLAEVLTKRKVELNIFTTMPNHFHLLVQEKTEGGISSYLQRLQNGYAKYFNTKYKKQGHLFQGAFRAIPVETDDQLIYLSAYIHRNPGELKQWENKEINYPWSSYQDLVKNNRWGKLLKPDIILSHFPNPQRYYEFIETSTAKFKLRESIINNLTLE
jgi:putative transposase